MMAGGCGRDQRDLQFQFQFRDAADRPVADVHVYYLAAGDTVAVGRTGSDGNILVSRKHFEQLPREFGFHFPAAHGEVEKEFDAEECEWVHSAIVGTHTYDSSAGIVQPDDLGSVPSGWRHPGRVVRLAFAPPGADPDRDVVFRRSMKFTISIRTTREAAIKIDGVDVGAADSQGDLDVPYCLLLDDGEIRTSVHIEISKAGHQTWRQTVPIPESGRPDEIVHDLVREVKKVSHTWLRVKQKALPRSCGEEHSETPSLYVNSKATEIGAEVDNAGWNIQFDLIVKAGQEYCLAIACREPADKTTWNPWDESAGEARWYRLHVPEDADRMLVEILTDLDPSQPLRPEIGADLEDFKTEQCVTIEHGCQR